MCKEFVFVISRGLRVVQIFPQPITVMKKRFLDALKIYVQFELLPFNTREFLCGFQKVWPNKIILLFIVDKYFFELCIFVKLIFNLPINTFFIPRNAQTHGALPKQHFTAMQRDK